MTNPFSLRRERAAKGRLARLFATAAAAALALAAFVAPPTTASAQTVTPSQPIAQLITDGGLRGAAASLDAAGSLNAADQFALGAMRFLGGIEAALHVRWRYGIGDVPMVPVMRAALRDNPTPEAWRPEAFEEMFEGLLAELAMAETALAEADRLLAESGGEVEVVLDLGGLWFDYDGDGAQSDDESLVFIASRLGIVRPTGDAPLLVRFDRADIAWLRAYVHLLSGVAETVLALNPSEAIAATTGPMARVADIAVTAPEEFARAADVLAPIILMMRADPDPERLARAHAHLLAMIRHSREFWVRVREETDNDREWIPNPNQVAAVGDAVVSEEMAEGWVGVLDEIEMVLEGRLLIPHWRFLPRDRTATVGINLRRVFLEPRPFDIVMWIHGAGAAPYLEEGPLMTGEAWRAFTRIARGDAIAYAIWFN